MGTRWNQTLMIFATRQMVIQIISAAIIMYPCCHCKLLNMPTFPNIHITNVSLLDYDIQYCDIFFHRCKNGDQHQTNCSESDIKNKLFKGTCNSYTHARIKYVCLGNGRLVKYVYEYLHITNIVARILILLIDK